MEKVIGIASKVDSTVIEYPRSNRSKRTVHISRFQIDGRQIKFESPKPQIINEGDQMLVVGNTQNGIFNALAYKNLTTGFEGYQSWFFILFGGVIFLGAGVAIISILFFFQTPGVGATIGVVIFGSVFFAFSALLLFWGARTLQAVNELRKEAPVDGESGSNDVVGMNMSRLTKPLPPPPILMPPHISVNANSIEQSASGLIMDVSKTAALQKVASAELTAGKMPEAVFAKFISLGIPADMITDGLSNLSYDRSTQYSQALNDFLEKRNKALQKKTELEIWDPLNETITADKFSADNRDSHDLYDKYALNPGLLRRNMYLLAILPIGTIIALFCYHDTILPSLRGLFNKGNGQMLLLLPFVPPYLYFKRIYGLQGDIVKFMVASANGWIYSPKQNMNRGQKTTINFSEVLDKGAENPTLQDESWGTFKNEQQTIPFWAGFYEYYKTSNVKVNNSQKRKKFEYAVYAIKLNTKLRTSFWLKPDNVLKSFFLQFRTKKIDVESAAFNRHFEVYYNGRKVDHQLEIVKALSPAVQVRLLELRSALGPYTMLFKSDMVFFMHDGELLKGMRTDFFKKVEIAEEDKFALEKRLKQIFAISGDIIPYLD